MYDPTIGRFLSEDPLGFEAGDMNLYRFVGNSPPNGTDPSGELLFVPAKEEATWAGVFQPDARLAKVNDQWLLVIPKRTEAAHDAIVARLRENKTFTEAQLPAIMTAAYGGAITAPTAPGGDLQDQPGGTQNAFVTATGGPATGRGYARLDGDSTFRYQAQRAYEQAGAGYLLTDDPKVQQLYAMAVAAWREEQAGRAAAANRPMMTAPPPDSEGRARLRSEEEKRRADDIRARAFKERQRTQGIPGGMAIDWDVIEQQRQVDLREDAAAWDRHGDTAKFVRDLVHLVVSFALTEGVGAAWGTPGAIWGLRLRRAEGGGVVFERGTQSVQFTQAELRSAAQNLERITTNGTRAEAWGTPIEQIPGHAPGLGGGGPLAARTLRPDQVNLSAIAENTVVRSPAEVRAVIGDGLRATGGHSDEISGLYSYLRQGRGAGYQGVTGNFASRPNVALANFQTSQGEVIAAIDVSRIEAGRVYNLANESVRRQFLDRFPRFQGMYDRIAGEGVIAVRGDIPSEAVVGLARVGSNLDAAAQQRLIAELLR